MIIIHNEIFQYSLPPLIQCTSRWVQKAVESVIEEERIHQSNTHHVFLILSGISDKEVCLGPNHALSQPRLFFSGLILCL